MTSEALDELYDAKQFLFWLSCQISTSIPYQIIIEVYVDGYTFHKELPKSFYPPTQDIKYYPLEPFTRYKKRTRLKYREQNKQYYEYKDGTIVY